MIILIGILISVFIILFILLRNVTPTKIVNYLVITVCSLIVLFIIFNPEVCITFSINGAKLFFFKVFPYVFPFMVLSNLIIAYDGINIYSKLLGILCKPQRLPKSASIILAISALCGYPLGAKYSCDLYENGLIDFDDFERLVNIASNAGPLFIVGSIGSSMLKNKFLGYILLISCYLSCIIMGIILPCNPHKKSTRKYNDTKQNLNTNFGISIKKSIENALQVSLQLMGFIVIFSVLIGIMKNNFLFNKINNPIIKSMILGCIEMTNGSFLISSSQITVELKVVLLSFLLCFGGFSILSQIYSFIGKYKISPTKFIFRKFIQGIIGGIICFILTKLFYLHETTYTFNTASNKFNFGYYILILLIFISPLILNKFKKVLFKFF